MTVDPTRGRTTSLRRLPRSNVPLPGQSLGGYVLNLAHRLEITPAQLIIATGLSDARQPQHLPVKLGLSLPADLLAAFCFVTSLTRDEALALTLQRDATLSVIPRMSILRSNAQWVDLTTTRYCPQCLKADTPPPTEGRSPHQTDLPPAALSQPNWRLDWMTPWALACVEHRCLLLSECPDCHTPIGHTSRPLRSLVANVQDMVSHPAECRAKRKPAPGERRTSICGSRLDECEAPPAGPSLVALQQLLDGILRGNDAMPSSLGSPVTGREYLLDLRTIAIALQLADTPSVVESGYPDLTAAARRHVGTRANSDWRSRSVIQPPPDHLAHVGLMLTAARLLDDPAGQTINAVNKAAQAANWQTWKIARARGETSPVLATHLITADQRRNTTAPVRYRSLVEDRAISFSPEHVPAYLSDEDFARHFSDLSPAYQARIRRHVPIAIARLAGDFPSARAAGAYLGHSDQATNMATGAVANALPGGLDEIRSRTATIAAQWESQPRINYHKPRAQIDHTWLIPENYWCHIRWSFEETQQAETGIDWDRRRLLHSIWFWAILTGGLTRDAPHLKHIADTKLRSATTKEVWRRIALTPPERLSVITGLIPDLRTTF